MNEIEFCNLIDCNFPYHDRQEASRLIDLACQFSPNAAYYLAGELARPPVSELEKINETVLLDLLDELDRQFEHPIKSMIFSICRKMIRGQNLSGNETIEALDNLQDYPGMYSAASIIYFSCDEESYFERIEAQYRTLIQSWENGEP